MEPSDLIKQYLGSNHLLQLATTYKNKPWSCNIYYLNDGYDIYWFSIESRRHSKEIKLNKYVSATIAVKYEKKSKVIGIQIEGVANKIISGNEYKFIAEKYAEKFGRSQKWIEDYCKNKTKHKLYKFEPSRFVLFDELDNLEFSQNEFIP